MKVPDRSIAAPPAFLFDHGAVSVPDIETAIDWYRRILGFEVERRFALPQGVALGAMMVRDGLRMEIFQPVNFVALPEERRSPLADVGLHGNKHVAFRVPDIEALAEWLEKAGADIAFKVVKDFGAALFLRDNAENLIEFAARPAT